MKYKSCGLESELELAASTHDVGNLANRQMSFLLKVQTQ